MLNLVQVMGFLGNAPELRYTQSGQACANFNIATSESWMDNKNQKQSHTEWHRVVVWGKPAENCAKFLIKGSPAHVLGKLRTRSWQDNSGVTKYTTEIIAKEVTFLPSGGNQQGGGAQPPRQNHPQNNQANPTQNHAADPGLPPSLDEIPF